MLIHSVVVAWCLQGQVDADSMRALIRDGYRQTQQQLSPLTLEYHIESSSFDEGTQAFKPDNKQTLEWQQEGHSIRGAEVVNIADTQQMRQDWGYHNSKLTVLTEMGAGPAKVNRTGRIKTLSTFESRFGDPWSRAVFLVLDRPRTTFAEFLEDKETKNLVIEKQKEGEEAYYRISADMKHGYHVVIWVAPEKGFLIKKLSTRNPRDLEILQEVVSFAEIKPGLFFPKEVSFVVTSKSGPLQKSRTVFSRIELAAHKQYELEIPAGTSVADEDKGLSYVAGPDWESNTAALPVPKPLVMTPVKSAVQEGARSSVIRIAGLAVLAATSLFGLVVMWKRRRAMPE